MSKFIDTFREEMSIRAARRQHQMKLKFAEIKANKMLAEGKSANEVASVLAPHIGCPCCGPGWWRDLVIQAHLEEGLPVPPELRYEAAINDGGFIIIAVLCIFLGLVVLGFLVSHLYFALWAWVVLAVAGVFYRAIKSVRRDA